MIVQVTEHIHEGVKLSLRKTKEERQNIASGLKKGGEDYPMEINELDNPVNKMIKNVRTVRGGTV